MWLAIPAWSEASASGIPLSISRRTIVQQAHDAGAAGARAEGRPKLARTDSAIQLCDPFERMETVAPRGIGQSG
jgi:hypothetical protein